MVQHRSLDPEKQRPIRKHTNRVPLHYYYRNIHDSNTHDKQPFSLKTKGRKDI